jgi:hypothetical protein
MAQPTILVRSAVIDDPLGRSPSSISSEDGIRPFRESSLAASFVFVESAANTPKISKSLSRHVTAVHNRESSYLSILLPDECALAILKSVRILHPATYLRTKKLILLLTNYRMILVEENDENVPAVSIPLTSILDVKYKTSDSSGLGIDVKTKDCRFFQFFCTDDGSSRLTNVPKLIQSIVFQLGAHQYFAMQCASLSVEDTPIYSPEKELERWQIFTPKYAVNRANSNFLFCATYPEHLLLPAGVSDDTLVGAAKFRDKNRIPVLSWASAAGGSIWRSSQPKSSLLNRSSDDEELLRQIGVKYIIDCRPMLNAYANIAHGAGVESLGNYHPGIELWFASIQNIHHVRDAWEKMFALSQRQSGGNETGWFAGLDATGWYDLLVSILRASTVLVEKVSVGNLDVLCRCSHGLDRTPQVVSLAMLCLDPYYRTIEGFGVLIEKEWVSMGHRFRTRNCLGQVPSDETSQIFFQWIECVYQLVMQHRDSFEFTPTYLMLVFQGMLSSRFGNFLFDCEADRKVHQHPLPSIWPYLWSIKHIFENRNYVHSNDPLEIDFRMAALRTFNEIWINTNRIII